VIVIGLTGGIASGKSTAAHYLRDRGAHVIDADRLGHRAYEPGTQAHGEVVEAFGADVLDSSGGIDRKALGAKVFGNPQALTMLTDIVWPEIRRMAEAEFGAVAAADPGGIVILEAAVLFEAGWQDLVDEIWVVVVDPAVAVARATGRDGTDAETVQKRIDAQLSNAERSNQADLTIDNSGNEAALKDQLDVQWRRLEDMDKAS
jgi:phosphopantetheine adenylyltransferase/dephospho-CoA kinase